MKILFISHDATRTGAVILLIKLIKWLKEKKDIKPYIICLRNEVLIDEFKSLGDTYVSNNKSFKLIINKLKNHSIDLIYFNSVVSLNILKKNVDFFLNNKTILHVHELDTIIKLSKSEELLTNVKIDNYIAVSNTVKSSLVKNYSIQPEKINTIYEYIDINEWNKNIIKSFDNKVIIAGIGYVHWRKGVDYFLSTAYYFQRKYPQKFEFWWIGKINDFDKTYIDSDIHKLNLGGKVKFLDELTDLKNIYPKIHLLLITSREDPYPTVALEAGINGIPIICWNKGTGISELVEKGCGVTIDYGDSHAMAETISDILNDHEKYKIMADKAMYLACEHDINIIGEKIFNIITETQQKKSKIRSHDIYQKNIVFSFPDGITLGGVTTLSIDIARHLSKRDHKVTFIEHKPYYGNPTLDFDIPKEISVINCKNQSHPDKLNLDINEFVNSYKLALPATFVPNWSYGTFAVCAKLASNYSNRMRVIGFAHADEPGYYEWLSYYQSMIHRFLAPNEEIASTLRSILPNRNKDVLTLPYAVETPDILDRHYSINTDKPLILLFMARIVQKQKRVFKLVELSELLDERNVNFELRIIGDGQDKPALLEKISKLNPSLQTRIKLKDTIPPSELERTWLDSDILILVSEYEGLSLTLLGAMANGCVPVVTNVRGTKSVIDHTKNGFISDIDDLSNMVSDIKFLDDNRNKLKEIGDAAHQSIKIKHSYENYINEFGLILEEIWQEPSRRWPAHRPLLHVKQPNVNVHNNKSLNGLSSKTIGQEIPYKKLVKAMGYKLIQKRGFQWLGGLTSMKKKY